MVRSHRSANTVQPLFQWSHVSLREPNNSFISWLTLARFAFFKRWLQSNGVRIRDHDMGVGETGLLLQSTSRGSDAWVRCLSPKTSASQRRQPITVVVTLKQRRQ
jgi:hypothetical protein